MKVEARQLVLKYGDVTAVDALSFSLTGNKIYGLLGRNGSGKSSLLSMIAAFRKQTSGDMLINGQPVFENAAITRQIALIREGGDTVDDSEKVSEALRYAEYLRESWVSDYAQSLVEKFQLPLKSKIGELSKGQRSTLGAVLGLAARAPLTMFDETYLGMDAPTRYAFYDEILKDFIEYPRTFILSTHLIEEVSSLFEEVLIIHKGRKLVQEEMETLLERGSALTGIAEIVDRHTRGLRIIGERSLGRTKSVMVFGDLTAQQRQEAELDGLEVSRLPLQELFVHLTEPTGGQS